MTQPFAKIHSNLQESSRQSLQSLSDASASRKRLFVRKPVSGPLAFAQEKPRRIYTQGAEQQRDQAGQNENEGVTTQAPKIVRGHRQTQFFKKDMASTSFLTIKELAVDRQIFDQFSALKYIHRNTDRRKCDSGDKYLQKTIKKANQIKNLSLQLNEKPKTGKIVEKVIEFTPNTQESCVQCCNMKKLNKILQQKIQRLQQRLYNRQQDIKILAQNLQNPLAEAQIYGKTQIKSKEETLREVEGWREWTARYQGTRKELSRALEKVRYLQIENGVLARYKQACSQAKRENEQLRQENGNLRRRLNTICRTGEKYKNREIIANQTGRCGKRGNTAFGVKMGKEEDTFSLELSEMSCQH